MTAYIAISTSPDRELPAAHVSWNPQAILTVVGSKDWRISSSIVIVVIFDQQSLEGSWATL
jgi:hypothetical protein